MSSVRFNIYLKKELADFADKLAAERARVKYQTPNRSRLIGELILEAKQEEDKKSADRKSRAAKVAA